MADVSIGERPAGLPAAHSHDASADEDLLGAMPPPSHDGDDAGNPPRRAQGQSDGDDGADDAGDNDDSNGESATSPAQHDGRGPAGDDDSGGSPIGSGLVVDDVADEPATSRADEAPMGAPARPMS